MARFLILIPILLLCTASPVPAMDEETRDALVYFSRVLETIKTDYVDDVDPQLLVRHAIHGMMANLDSHSAFLTPKVLDAFQDKTRGGFNGLGLSLGQDEGKLTVGSVFKGSPAHRSGIMSGDVILKIDGRPVRGMTFTEATAGLKGPAGSRVSLSYTRPGVSEFLSCQLTREMIPKDSVKGMMLDIVGFGYIAVTQFRGSTLKDLEDNLEDLESSDTGLKGLILDLRNNPGGPLEQALSVSDLFLDQGVIVSIKGRKSYRIFNARPNTVKRAYPVIVLINGASASASEIVAAALQDNGRAVVIGTPSFGKGSVQTLIPFKDGYGLTFTIARYYTPNNRSIQGTGISPDIRVEPGESGDVAGDLIGDPQIKAALAALKEKTDQITKAVP